MGGNHQDIPGFFYGNLFLYQEKQRYFKIFENHVAGTSYPYSLENIRKKDKICSEKKKMSLFSEMTRKTQTCFFQRNLDREIGKFRSGSMHQSIAYSYDILWANRLFMHHMEKPDLDYNSLITCLDFIPYMNHVMFGTSCGLLGAIRLTSSEYVHESPQWNIFRSTSELTSLSVGSNGKFVCTFMGNEKNPGHFQIGTIRKNTQDSLDYDINVSIMPRGKNVLWASAIAPLGQLAVIGGSRIAMVIKGIDDSTQYVPYFYHLKSDVFAVKFLNINVFLIGCRNGWVDFFDIRCADSVQSCSTELGIRHKSSVTNFGLIGDYHLIVAGLENSLDMYDIRMIRSVKNSFSRSILSFNGYENEYSFGLGFDINCNERIVAAAGQNQICFWSTIDGKLLREKTIKSNNTSRALKFHQISTRWHEELCVANGAYLEWWCSN